MEPCCRAGPCRCAIPIGCCYMDGEVVEQNISEAVRLWSLAAEQGLADAQYQLGVAYLKGDAVEQSNAEAEKLWRLAVEQGECNSMAALGDLLYDKGEFFDAMSLWGNAYRYGDDTKAKKTIQKNRLSWIKSIANKFTADTEGGLNHLQIFSDFINEKIDEFIVECKDKGITQPDIFTYSTNNNRNSYTIYLNDTSRPRLKSSNFRCYLLTKVLVSEMLCNESMSPEDAAAHLNLITFWVQKVDAQWVISELFLAIRQLGIVLYKNGIHDRAIAILNSLEEWINICYLSQYDEDDIEMEYYDSAEIENLLFFERMYYINLTLLLHCYLNYQADNSIVSRALLDNLFTFICFNRHFSSVADDWLLEQFNEQESEDSALPNLIKMLYATDNLHYMLAPVLGMLNEELQEGDADKLLDWSRSTCEVAERVFKVVARKMDECGASARDNRMQLSLAKGLYYMFTRRYKLAEQNLCECINLFNEINDGGRRDYAVADYCAALLALCKYYYSVKGNLNEKRDELAELFNALTEDERDCDAAERVKRILDV